MRTARSTLRYLDRRQLSDPFCSEFHDPSENQLNTHVSAQSSLRDTKSSSLHSEIPCVEVVLFDADPIRRHVWERLCEKRGLPLQANGFVAERHFTDGANSRAIIFDQSALETSGLDPFDVLKKFSRDAIAFTFKNCQVATVAKLISAGASWVFDNGSLTNEFEDGFTELVKCAEELNAQLKSFQRTEAIRAKFTAGEREVLELVIQGIPNKLIAKKLDISTRTVETRRAKVYRKCQVQNVTELVRFVDRANALRAKFGG